MRTIAFVLALASLAACDSQAPESSDTTATATPTLSATPAPSAAPTVAQAETGTGIPATMLGRWGLGPADCEPGRDDAKGLLEISAEGLKYYESMGKLGAIAERSADRLRAEFAFTGEGMSWTRDMELVTGNGGASLTAREFGEGAAPAPLEYARCP